MPTFTALTTLRGEEEASALGEALEAADPEPTGVGVFKVEDGSGLWEVGGYFQSAPDLAQLAILSAAFGAAEFVVSELPETDWVSKVRRELHPVEAGRFFVYGSHDADKVPDDRIALLIEAAMAFGTGHHGTTLGCLQVLDRLVDEGFSPEAIADIGCGTAVLAMAAARVWPARVIASDIDEVAVEVARANLVANDLAARVETVEAAGFDHEALAGPFDLVFANILKGPLSELAAPMAARTKPGGMVILSGILTEQAEGIMADYRAAGFNPVHRTDIVEWSTLLLERNAA